MAGDDSVDPAFVAIAQLHGENVVLLDGEGRIRFANWTVPGLTPEHVLGTHVTEHVEGRSRENLLRCLERVRVTCRPDRYDAVYAAPDGQLSRWEARVSPVLRGTELAGFCLVSNIVSERGDAAADRDRLFDLTLDALVVADGQGRVIDCNPALEHITGFARREVIGRVGIELLHPDDRPAATQVLSRAGSGDRSPAFECRLLTKAGSYRWVSWSTVGDPERQVVYGAGRDVTETRALQAQVQQAQKMDAVGQLAGGVAHDFNNLLLAISANAELARDARGREALVSHLGEIEQAVKRAASLTKQLLAFSRQQSSVRTVLDLNRVARELLTMLRRVIPTTIELELRESPELPSVHGDRTQLEQVLVNLCLNARDAMPEGGRITLTTREIAGDDAPPRRQPWMPKGRFVAITVEDTGHGMTPEVRERAFEPFFTTKGPSKGTGLGLSTVYGIVRQHDGVVHLASALGEGTTFTVCLPVSDGANVAAGSEPAPAADGGHETILVAEDEEAVRRVVTKMLESAGYTVLTACDGIEAVRTYERNAPAIALVLLDVVMPRRGGIETHAALRRLNPTLPLIFTSGYNDAEQLSAVLQADPASARRVLSKPYDRDTLLRAVRAALDSP